MLDLYNICIWCIIEGGFWEKSIFRERKGVENFFSNMDGCIIFKLYAVLVVSGGLLTMQKRATE